MIETVAAAQDSNVRDMNGLPDLPTSDAGNSAGTTRSRTSKSVAVGAAIWRFFCSAPFAYFMIVAVQMKIMWGIWELTDLTPGDTCGYFLRSKDWYQHFQVNIAWSPLYTAFWGTLMWVTDGIFAVTTLHRIVIACLATILVLAIMRRMLPHALAWVIACWWAFLPINFNSRYEVHLFGVLPLLISWLLILRRPDAWLAGPNGALNRGFSLAVLVVATFLVRNETIVAFLVLLTICVIYEWRGIKHRRADLSLPRVRTTKLVACYAVPMFIALSIVPFFYWRSTQKFPNLSDDLKAKHTLNMAQVYAFGYSQRHPEWTKSPWTDSRDLCQSVFGVPEPSLGQMLHNNFWATMEHWRWNLSLWPAGMQVSLFNCSSFGKQIPEFNPMNPDYAPVDVIPNIAIRDSLAAFAIVSLGLLLFLLFRRRWWTWWIKPRGWGWAAMFSAAVMAIPIVLTQRPRPSYLFSLTILMMAIVGTGLWIIGASLVMHWPMLMRRLGRLANVLMPLVMFAALVGFSRYYWNRRLQEPRSLLKTIVTLEPYQNKLRSDKVQFLKGEYATEVKLYLTDALAQVYDYSALADEKEGLKPDQTLAEFLDKHNFNYFYLDTIWWNKLDAERPGIVGDLVRTGDTTGWRVIGYHEHSGDDADYLSRWILFEKAEKLPTGKFAVRPTGVIGDRTASGGASFGGWVNTANLGGAEGPYPEANLPIIRWGIGPSTDLIVVAKQEQEYEFQFSANTDVPDLKITVTLDGAELGKYDWKIGPDFTDKKFEFSLKPGSHKLSIAYSDTLHSAQDRRPLAVKFRTLKVEPKESAATLPSTQPTTRP
jgi:hypothetical protein